jgi:hypothetical protein
MAGRYTDDGDPDPRGGGTHKFTGSICQTDPTTRNPDGQPTFHAMCKDGYQESPDSTHHYYVCDHTGHWVVGTKGCAGCEGDGCKGCNDANPYLPPEDPGGQGLECLGQMCPDDGQTPHDGDCGGNCNPTLPGKQWPSTNFEPCYTTDSDGRIRNPKHPTPKQLHYSDTCNSTDPKEWGDDCHCTSECVTGYTADGTVNGITNRTFRCLQETNAPYFGTSKSRAHEGPQVEALVCKAVTCGDVMDTDNHPNGHMPAREGKDPYAPTAPQYCVGLPSSP